MSGVISIVPGQRSDSEYFSHALLVSKLSLSVKRLLYKNWPDEEVQKKKYSRIIENGFDDPTLSYFKAVNQSGDNLGFIALANKEVQKDGDNEAKPAKDNNQTTEAIPGSMNADVVNAVMEAVGELAKSMQNQDRYEIIYIYVNSDARNQGVGKKLVQHAQDAAKADGIPLFITSEPQIHGFFSKLGFTDTDHADFDLSHFAPQNSGYGVFRLSAMRWMK